MPHPELLEMPWLSYHLKHWTTQLRIPSGADRQVDRLMQRWRLNHEMLFASCWGALHLKLTFFLLDYGLLCSCVLQRTTRTTRTVQV